MKAPELMEAYQLRDRQRVVTVFFSQPDEVVL
jgi:hypothetical protein